MTQAFEDKRENTPEIDTANASGGKVPMSDVWGGEEYTPEEIALGKTLPLDPPTASENGVETPAESDDVVEAPIGFDGASGVAARTDDVEEPATQAAAATVAEDDAPVEEPSAATSNDGAKVEEPAAPEPEEAPIAAEPDDSTVPEEVAEPSGGDTGRTTTEPVNPRPIDDPADTPSPEPEDEPEVIDGEPVDGYAPTAQPAGRPRYGEAPYDDHDDRGYRAPASPVAGVRATVRDAADAISDVHHNLADRFAGPLQPEKIITEAVKMAKKTSVKWGPADPRETPNYFDVYVSSKDWNDRYGIRGNDIEERISRKIIQEFAGTNYRMSGDPVIAFFEDPSLVAGSVVVTPSFGIPQTLDEEEPAPAAGQTPTGAPAPEPEAQPGKAPEAQPVAEPESGASQPQDPAQPIPPMAPTQMPRRGPVDGVEVRGFIGGILAKLGSWFAGIVGAGKPAAASRHGASAQRPGAGHATPPVQGATPPPSRPAVANARLSWRGGSAFVRPDSAMGVVWRPNDKNIPDIQLPSDKFNAGISQIHGVFLHHGGTWYYEHRGQYATFVKLPNDKEASKLERTGQKLVICDGTVLSFEERTLPSITFNVS